MNDVPEVIRAFSPYVEIDNDAEDFIELSFNFENDSVIFCINSNVSPSYKAGLNVNFDNQTEYKRAAKRFVTRQISLALMNAFRPSMKTGRSISSGFFFGARRYRHANCMPIKSTTLIPAFLGSMKSGKLTADISRYKNKSRLIVVSIKHPPEVL